MGSYPWAKEEALPMTETGEVKKRSAGIYSHGRVRSSFNLWTHRIDGTYVSANATCRCKKIPGKAGKSMDVKASLCSKPVQLGFYTAMTLGMLLLALSHRLSWEAALFGAALSMGLLLLTFLNIPGKDDARAG